MSLVIFWSYAADRGKSVAASVVEAPVTLVQTLAYVVAVLFADAEVDVAAVVVEHSGQLDGVDSQNLPSEELVVDNHSYVAKDQLVSSHLVHAEQGSVDAVGVDPAVVGVCSEVVFEAVDG